MRGSQQPALSEVERDHAELRRDPLLAVAAGKLDPLGAERRDRADRGHALAAAPTLNRLELGNSKQSRYHKISHDPQAIEATLLALGVRALPRDTTEVVLDFDASDDPLHGRQEGRLLPAPSGAALRAKAPPFGCLAPLGSTAPTAHTAPCRSAPHRRALLLCRRRDPLGAVAPQRHRRQRGHRRGAGKNRRGAAAALSQGAHHRARRQWPVRLRSGQAFCREAIMAWCQAQAEVCYCLGLAKNARLTGLLAPALDRAREKQILCGGASVRDFAELSYRTLESPSAQSSGPRGWSRERRARPMHLPPLVPYAAASVIGKAEVSAQGDNPRFILRLRSGPRTSPRKALPAMRRRAPGALPRRGFTRSSTAGAGKWALRCGAGEHGQADAARPPGHAREHPLDGQQPAPALALAPLATCSWSGPFGCAQGGRCGR